MKKPQELLTSKSFDEGQSIKKKIAIKYNGIPWGIANATIFYENLVLPPRKNYNHRYIRVVANYSGRKFLIHSVKGETKGALVTMKKLIEKSLKS